ncbi:MAG: hypothetical protein AAB358_03875 [Patescibacteria group bacterium]
MFIKDQFQKINIPFKGKVIALSIIGVVFLLLLFFSVRSQYLKDTLVDFVPSDAAVYFHLSLPQLNRSVGIENLVHQILADAGLADFPLNDIKREIGIVGRIKDNKLNFSYLVRTDRPKRLAEFLNDKKLNYKFLRSDLALLSQDLSADFKAGKENQIAIKTKNQFSNFETIRIYLRREAVGYFDDDLLKSVIGFLPATGDDFFLSARAKNGGLKITSLGEKKIKPKKSKPVALQSDFDLIFSTNELDKILKPLKGSAADSSFWGLIWQSYIKRGESRYGLDLSGSLADELKRGKMLFLLSPRATSFLPAVFSRQFYLSFSLSQPMGENEVKEMEEVLKKLMAWSYPKEKAVFLSDGTKIVELMPDISRFSFTDENGVKAIDSPDGQTKIFYQKTDNFLAISNSFDLLGRDFSAVNWDYLKIKFQLLPINTFWRYLVGFKVVEFLNGEVSLK